MESNKVGEILQKARRKKLLTYEDVSAQTKIHPYYLKALEEGNFSAFSSEVHLKGFLKTYAAFLDLSVDNLLAFLRREYLGKDEDAVVSKVVKPLNAPRVILTPGLILGVSGLILVVAFFSYLFVQYRAFAGSPLLIVEQPIEEKLEIDTSQLTLAGRTDPDSELKINGQRISLGEGGVFSASITLTDGLNVLNVVSKNKLGKESRVTRTVVVQKSQEAVAEPAEPRFASDTVEVEVVVGPNAAWVEVEVDGQKEFDGLLAAGVVKIFTGRVKIRILSGNAGSTQVTVNGEKLGPIGGEGEVLEKIYKKENIKEESVPSKN